MNAARLTLVLLVMMLAGTPGQVAAQDSGYALRFDGASDWVRLHPTASMMGPTWATTKTVSLWVNPLGAAHCTAQSAGACDVVFGDRPRIWGISRGTLGGQDRLWVWNHDGATAQIGIDYAVGEWVHIALVHDGQTLSAYKNGALVGSVASGPTLVNTSQVLHFGGIINNAARNWTFEGEIDEVQIWNAALSAQEIAATAAAPLSGNEPGLVAYYRMSDGAGTWLTDDSGNSWTGTLLDGGSGVPSDGAITWVASGAFGGTIEPPPHNTRPVADPAQVTTAEDTPVDIALSGSDADGDPLTFHVVASPSHGVVSGTGANLVYTPHANFHGLDGFTFVVHDGYENSDPATVTITVTPVNDPPVAVGDTATAAIDTPVVINVLTNDYDIDGDALTVSAVGAAQHGSVTNNVYSVTYTPPIGFTGSDAFTYTITDGHGGFSMATVLVSVTQSGADPGFALRFDGVSDYVRFARTADMLAPGWETTKTVSLWVRPTGTPMCTLPQPMSCDLIFGDRPRWWGISRGIINGQDRIWVWNYDLNGVTRSIPIEYVTGDWVHIALVHGGGVLAAYKNGALVGFGPSGGTMQPGAPAMPVLHLGGVINHADRNWTFEGDIDEVQIWNLARTEAQLTFDMAGPLFGTEPGLAAYYRMSDGGGLLLTDDSGNGWTGDLMDGGVGVPADGPILWVPSGAFTIGPPQ